MGILKKHDCTMSGCTIDYDPKEMIYSVTFQCRDCGKSRIVKMNSNCVHDFLAAVTMGF